MTPTTIPSPQFATKPCWYNGTPSSAGGVPPSPTICFLSPKSSLHIRDSFARRTRPKLMHHQMKVVISSITVALAITVLLPLCVCMCVFSTRPGVQLLPHSDVYQ